MFESFEPAVVSWWVFGCKLAWPPKMDWEEAVYRAGNHDLLWDIF